jgi:hypothetical protein
MTLVQLRIHASYLAVALRMLISWLVDAGSRLVEFAALRLVFIIYPIEIDDL